MFQRRAEHTNMRAPNIWITPAEQGPANKTFTVLHIHHNISQQGNHGNHGNRGPGSSQNVGRRSVSCSPLADWLNN